MSELAVIGGALAIAVPGIFFVKWVVSRCLPAPFGPFLWISFLICFQFSVVVAAAVYMSVAGPIWYYVFQRAFESVMATNEVVAVTSMLIIGMPFWFGIVYGIWLQIKERKAKRHV